MKGDNQDDWVAEWFAGWPQPSGPKSGRYLNSQLANDPGYSTFSDRLRVQGHGTLLIYRITGDETPTPQDIAAENNPAPKPDQATPALPQAPPETVTAIEVPAAPKPDPRPARKLMHMAPENGQPDDLAFYLEEYHHSSDSIICTGNMTNATDERVSMGLAWRGTTIVDDKQNMLQIGRVAFSGGIDNEDLLPNVPLGFSYTLYEPHAGVTAITLNIFAGKWGHPDRLLFSNVPVQ